MKIKKAHATFRARLLKVRGRLNGWSPSKTRSEQYRPTAVALRTKQPDVYASLLDATGKVLRNMGEQDVERALRADPDLAVAFLLALREAKKSERTR